MVCGAEVSFVIVAAGLVRECALSVLTKQKNRDLRFANTLPWRLSDLFGLSVNIGRRQEGVLHVRYRNCELLEELLRRLRIHINQIPEVQTFIEGRIVR